MTVPETGSTAEGLVYRRNPEITLTRFGDEGLLVVPRAALQAVLNGTATRVLELVDGRRTVGEIADRLAEEYDGPSREDLVRDVGEILVDLHGRGAVEPAETA
ncbi:MAG: hypothetical protein Kow0062_26160 [Acidobacteriota bacterium]